MLPQGVNINIAREKSSNKHTYVEESLLFSKWIGDIFCNLFLLIIVLIFKRTILS